MNIPEMVEEVGGVQLEENIFQLTQEDLIRFVELYVEEEFGQWVTYSAYCELLKQLDKLEEAGLGYWLMDEFVLIKESNL